MGSHPSQYDAKIQNWKAKYKGLKKNFAGKLHDNKKKYYLCILINN